MKIQSSKQEPKKTYFSRKLRIWGRYGIITFALLFALFPIVWIVLTSFKTPSEVIHSPPIWIPREPSFNHYVGALKLRGLTAFKNSMIIASASTVLSLLLGSMGAYSIAKWGTGGKLLPLSLLAMRMLPPIAVVFPVFLIFKTLQWIDTYRAVILMHLTFNLPFSIWMLRGFFAEIPKEVEESARIDGCSELGVFGKITLPLAAPGLIATGIFCFIFSWSEYPFALVLTRRNAITLSVVLPGYFGSEMIFWGEVGALSTIAILPLFILGILVKKHLTRGLTMGAVK